MAIQFRTLDQLAQLQLDYITANAPVVLNTPLGPFVTAIAYSTALVALVLQRIVKMVLDAARLATATNGDVDTYLADFDLSRLPGVPATGTVTFGRFSPAAASVLIPDGTVVQTNTSPPVQFQTVPSSLAGYDSTQQGYVLAPGATSIDGKVQALVADSSGNVAAQAINKIGSPLPGIDFASNGAAFTNGVDEETDDAAKARFALFILSLSKATPTAIVSAVTNLQPGIIVDIFEPDPPDGSFRVVVDDGTGAPSAGLISDASGAVDAVRPVGVRPIVAAPTLQRIVLTVQIEYNAALTPNPADLQAAIRSNIAGYVNGLHGGQSAHYGQIFNAIWSTVSPGDKISTTIAQLPISTTTSLYVDSVEGMQVGQLVAVALGIFQFLTASGQLPEITLIDPDKRLIEVSPPLIAAPPATTVVQAFSVSPTQIIDANAVQLGAQDQSGAGTTVKASPASTTTRVYLTSITGFTSGHYVVVGNFQPADGSLVTISAVGSDYIDVSAPLGLGFGTGWVATAPTTGTTVVSTVGGTVDVPAPVDLGAGIVTALRTSTFVPQAIYVGMQAG